MNSLKATGWITLGLLSGSVAANPLNDTGVTECATFRSGHLNCASSDVAPQDGQVGRDVSARDDADGHAGFSFAKVDAEGQILPSSADSWACVYDQVTGLTWEVKTDDGGVHDKDWTYSWRQPDKTRSGGSVGQKNNGTCQNTKDCDTYALTVASNTEKLCGYDDWRVPSREELQGIVDFSSRAPAIDSRYFPETNTAVYWSATPGVDNTAGAWLINFTDGNDAWSNKTIGHFVRLVRGGQ